MNVELHFAPGACSFVPHVALEAVRAATGREFTPKLVKLHKGEHLTPEYRAMNPDAQVPLLVVDGKPLTQIVAICDWIDCVFPTAKLLPTDPWERALAMAQLAWMNNTAHPAFNRVFMPQKYAESESARAEVKAAAVTQYRACLARIEGWVDGASPWLQGEHLSFSDAYAFTLLRWGGFAGIDPAGFPSLLSHVERVMQAPAAAAALERERIKLDTYKPAAP
jgi:glutathione S-transferase